MKNIILLKKIKNTKLKKIQFKKSNTHSLIKKKNNNKISIQKNVNNNLNNSINDFTSKYNKIITSLNNKINNSEFINNENDLLQIYFEELNDFYNSIMNVF